MTTEEFDAILRSKLREMTGEQLLTMPGIYEIVSEELNNEVLDAWWHANFAADAEAE